MTHRKALREIYLRIKTLYKEEIKEIRRRRRRKKKEEKKRKIQNWKPSKESSQDICFSFSGFLHKIQTKSDEIDYSTRDFAKLLWFFRFLGLSKAKETSSTESRIPNQRASQSNDRYQNELYRLDKESQMYKDRYLYK